MENSSPAPQPGSWLQSNFVEKGLKFSTENSDRKLQRLQYKSNKSHFSQVWLVRSSLTTSFATSFTNRASILEIFSAIHCFTSVQSLFISWYPRYATWISFHFRPRRWSAFDSLQCQQKYAFLFLICKAWLAQSYFAARWPPSSQQLHACDPVLTVAFQAVLTCTEVLQTFPWRSFSPLPNGRKYLVFFGCTFGNFH